MSAVDDSAVDQAKEDMEKEQEKVKDHIWKESGTYRRKKQLEEEMDREIEESDSK